MLTQIINARILTPQGWLKDGSVLIRDNKILEVTNCDLAIVVLHSSMLKECISYREESRSMYMAEVDVTLWKALKMHSAQPSSSHAAWYHKYFPTLSSSTIPMIRAAAETNGKINE